MAAGLQADHLVWKGEPREAAWELALHRVKLAQRAGAAPPGTPWECLGPTFWREVLRYVPTLTQQWRDGKAPCSGLKCAGWVRSPGTAHHLWQ